jgi:hypothetical protein
MADEWFEGYGLIHVHSMRLEKWERGVCQCKCI